VFQAQIVPIASTHCFAIVGCRYMWFLTNLYSYVYFNVDLPHTIINQTIFSWRSETVDSLLAIRFLN